MVTENDRHALRMDCRDEIVDCLKWPPQRILSTRPNKTDQSDIPGIVVRDIVAPGWQLIRNLADLGIVIALVCVGS